MTSSSIPAQLRRHEIPERVEIASGKGGLPALKIRTPWSRAEIYLHGAHVTHFQKNGEPPLIFMSAKSHFAPGKAIRGGIPICFPWFGPRDGEPAHGLARLLAWELAETSAAKDGSAVGRLRLPKELLKAEWSVLRTEFVVTIADTLTMELIATNMSKDKSLKIENCLHAYLHVGDIGAVSISGLQNVPFNDFAAGAGGTPRAAEKSALRIPQETNRVYPNHAGAVEIRDEKLKRAIRVEKFNSKSTVVWNPWTTQKMPEDWGASEHLNMVCVESGNVKQDKISLSPGETAALKVILGSKPLK
jgi:D-hexose-6-phosphate mutarotase